MNHHFTENMNNISVFAVWLLETKLDSLGDSAINDFMRDAKS